MLLNTVERHSGVTFLVSLFSRCYGYSGLSVLLLLNSRKYASNISNSNLQDQPAILTDDIKLQKQRSIQKLSYMPLNLNAHYHNNQYHIPSQNQTYTPSRSRHNSRDLHHILQSQLANIHNPSSSITTQGMDPTYRSPLNNMLRLH